MWRIQHVARGLVALLNFAKPSACAPRTRERPGPFFQELDNAQAWPEIIAAHVCGTRARNPGLQVRNQSRT